MSPGRGSLYCADTVIRARPAIIRQVGTDKPGAACHQRFIDLERHRFAPPICAHLSCRAIDSMAAHGRQALFNRRPKTDDKQPIVAYDGYSARPWQAGAGSHAHGRAGASAQGGVIKP